MLEVKGRISPEEKARRRGRQVQTGSSVCLWADAHPGEQQMAIASSVGTFSMRGPGVSAWYNLQQTPQSITYTPPPETASIVIPARSISLARAGYSPRTHAPAMYNPLLAAG